MTLKASHSPRRAVGGRTGIGVDDQVRDRAAVADRRDRAGAAPLHEGRRPPAAGLPGPGRTRPGRADPLRLRLPRDPQLRREIHTGLQVVENWNSANDKIYYGPRRRPDRRRREHAEVSMLALHLLQSSLVFINTQLLQAVLRDPA